MTEAPHIPVAAAAAAAAAMSSTRGHNNTSRVKDDVLLIAAGIKQTEPKRTRSKINFLPLLRNEQFGGFGSFFSPLPQKS
jgi:hypothetical protein